MTRRNQNSGPGSPVVQASTEVNHERLHHRRRHTPYPFLESNSWQDLRLWLLSAFELCCKQRICDRNPECKTTPCNDGIIVDVLGFQSSHVRLDNGSAQ